MPRDPIVPSGSRWANDDTIRLAQVLVTLEFLERKIDDLKLGMAELRKENQELISALKKDTVSKGEFWPVRIVTFGLVGIIVIAVVSALVAGVVPTGVH